MLQFVERLPTSGSIWIMRLLTPDNKVTGPEIALFRLFIFCCGVFVVVVELLRLLLPVRVRVSLLLRASLWLPV